MHQIRLLNAPAKGFRLQRPEIRGKRAVSVRARSYDPVKRTFEFTLASETPCLTYRLDRHWNLVEVEEILPMAALRGLEGFAGCPLLDSHMSWSVRDVLGRVTGIRVADKELVGSAFLSDRDDVVGIARDLQTGVLGEFSVGFEVHDDGEIEEREGELPLIRVKSWSVREGSLVPIPADPTATMRGARQRSAGTLPNRNPKTGNRKMTNEQLAALIAGYRSSSTALMTGLEGLLTPPADGSTPPATSGDDLESQAAAAAEEARAAFIAARSAPTPPTVVPSAAGQRSAEDQKAIAGLKIVCGKRGLADEFDAMEKAGASVAELRNILGSGLRTSGATVQTVVLTPAGDAKRGKLNAFGESEIGKQRMAAK